MGCCTSSPAAPPEDKYRPDGPDAVANGKAAPDAAKDGPSHNFGYQEGFESQYKLGSELGKGQYGTAYTCGPRPSLCSPCVLQHPQQVPLPCICPLHAASHRPAPGIVVADESAAAPTYFVSLSPISLLRGLLSSPLRPSLGLALVRPPAGATHRAGARKSRPRCNMLPSGSTRRM